MQAGGFEVKTELPLLLLSSITAPSSPPSRVNATVESATSIQVNWSEVPAIDRNGIITQYEVRYEPLETFGGQLAERTNITNNSTFEILLENLQEYVQYNITVRAFTQVGEGPSSPTITFRTREAGKCIGSKLDVCINFTSYFLSLQLPPALRVMSMQLLRVPLPYK